MYNLDKKVEDINGVAFPARFFDDGSFDFSSGELTFRDVIISSLIAPRDDISCDEVYKRFQLSLYISSGGDISESDVESCIDAVEYACANSLPVIYGRTRSMLEEKC